MVLLRIQLAVMVLWLRMMSLKIPLAVVVLLRIPLAVVVEHTVGSDGAVVGLM